MVDISIIIPVYKVERYITRCFKSILEQDLKQLRVECIFVDDCSPDNSMALVKQLIIGYEGPISIISIRHDKNKGLSAARNSGISIAQGEYLLFVDSDDHLSPGAIRKLYEGAVGFPKADLIKGNYYSVKSKASYPICVNEKVSLNSDQFCYALLNYQINCTAWNLLIRSEFLKRNNLYFVDGLLFEDINWSYRVSRLIREVVLIPDVTYIYEDDNPLSIMNTTSEKVASSVRSYIFICNSILDDIPSQYFIDALLYVFVFVVKAIILKENAELPLQLEKSFKLLKKRLINMAIKRANFVLVLYLMLMYKPFSGLYHFGWFRRHNNYLDAKVRFWSVCFEKLIKKV